MRPMCALVLAAARGLAAVDGHVPYADVVPSRASGTFVDCTARQHQRAPQARSGRAEGHGRLSLRDWHTATFFEVATADDVTACLAEGADPRERRVLHHAARFHEDAAVTRALLDAGADPNGRTGARDGPLHHAARYNANPEVTAALLAGGAGPERRGYEGSTPLHRAAMYSRVLEVTLALLGAGADPLTEDDAGWAPLHYAIGNANPAVARALASAAGARSGEPWASLAQLPRDEDFAVAHARAAAATAPPRDRLGRTLLHHAARSNPFAAVTEALLATGAEPNAPDLNGRTALQYAAEHNGSSAVAVALLAAGADPGLDPGLDHDGWTALHGAAKGGDVAVVQALLDAGADTGRRVRYRSGVDDRTPLHVAAGSNAHGDVISALVDAGADIEAATRHGWRPLHHAADTNGARVTAALVAAGANTAAATERGFTPLHLAARREDPLLVVALLEGGADQDARDGTGRRPLHWATRSAAVVARLLEGGAAVDARDGQGRTPLHGIADSPVWDDSVAIARELVGRGADPNLTDGRGNTALHLAAGSEATYARALVAALLSAGADVDRRNDRGHTPLHAAAASKDRYAIDSIDMLLTAGAEPSARDEDGDTPLHLAVLSPAGDAGPRIVALLRAAEGALCENTVLQTPWDIARGMSGRIAAHAVEDLRHSEAYLRLNDARLAGSRDWRAEARGLFGRSASDACGREPVTVPAGPPAFRIRVGCWVCG